MNFVKSHLLPLLGFFLIVIAVPVTGLLAYYRQEVNAHAQGGNITISYGQPLRTLSPLAVGGVDESAYGVPNVLVNDPLQQQKLKMLGTRYMRMNLKYTIAGDPTSKIICGAQGCDTRWSGDEWVNAIKALGAEVVVEDPVNPTDLPLLVKHFNKDTNNRVSRWLGGINEPNLNGQNATTYSTNFNSNYDAMKAVDPTIKIGGPTVAWYDSTFLQTFLTMSGSRVDFLDFHGYPQGPTTQLPYDQLFTIGAKYETDLNDLYSRIQKTVPTRASQIEVQVGEWDLNYAGHLLEYTQFNTAWGASTLGHIIKGGGIDMLYADKGNLLLKTGAEIPGGTLDMTTPMYHALGMYTGEGLFRHFGNILVQTSTSLPNIEVYASDAPKNVVVINKDPALSQNGVFQADGVADGVADVWTKDLTIPVTDPPMNKGRIAVIGGAFSYTLPPFSVTTFVITPNPVTSATPVPSSSPSVKPSPSFLPPVVKPSPSPTASPVTSTSCSGDGVYLYSDINFTGVCTKFTADVAELRGTVINSDAASSIRLVGGYTATLFADGNFSGAWDKVSQDLPTLSGTNVGNDNLSSIQVQQKPASAAQVVSFSLIDASTKKVITGYTNLSGTVILSLSKFKTKHFNVQAVTTPSSVGSVLFSLDQVPNFHIENYADYFLAGKSGNYWQPTVGNHVITATPFDGTNASGNAGKSDTLNFIIQP